MSDNADAPIPALPTPEVDRVLDLLGKAGGEVHDDLRAVLGEPDADKLANDILCNEIHDPRT